MRGVTRRDGALTFCRRAAPLRDALQRPSTTRAARVLCRAGDVEEALRQVAIPANRILEYLEVHIEQVRAWAA